MTIRIFRFAKAAALVPAVALLCGAKGPGCDSNPIEVGYDDAGSQTGTGVDAGADTSFSPGINSAPLGGCPGTEPAAGSACSIGGRLCTWTRSCGAASTVDTGWCLGSGTWQLAPGICKDGCPPARPAINQGGPLGVGAAPPPGEAGSNTPGGADAAMTSTGSAAPNACTLGTQCFYPSTPLDPGAIQCTCNVQGDGTLYWGQGGYCDAWNDGWIPASGGGSSNCGELVKCSGASGCAGACSSAAPGATTSECGCGEDGLYYCSVTKC